MTSSLIRLHTAGLIALKEEKVLLAFSNHKKAWYLPGGKIDAGETPREALCREISEELSTVIDPQKLRYIGRITAPAWGERPNVIMEQDCFRCNLEAQLQASGEIGGLRYFDAAEYSGEPAQVPGVLQVFDWLRDGLLDEPLPQSAEPARL